MLFDVKTVKVQWHRSGIAHFVMKGTISDARFFGDFIVRKGVKTPLEVKFVKADLLEKELDAEYRFALAGAIKSHAKILIKKYIQDIPNYVKID